MPLHWYSFHTLSPCLFLEKLHPSTFKSSSMWHPAVWQMAGLCFVLYTSTRNYLEILSLIQQLTQPSFATGLYWDFRNCKIVLRDRKSTTLKKIKNKNPGFKGHWSCCLCSNMQQNSSAQPREYLVGWCPTYCSPGEKGQKHPLGL